MSVFKALAALVLATSLASVTVAAGLYVLLEDETPITIQSRESRTLQGKPVFNRIRYVAGFTHDTWIMQQSHTGPATPPETWDRLVIEVDKRSGTARFKQLQPGPSQPHGQSTSLRVACYLCHSNGPRAVRPDAASAQAPLSLKAKAQILAWNLRIKTYGRLHLHRDNDPVESVPKSHLTGNTVPTRYAFKADNEPLPLKSCQTCHFEGAWGRGVLRRQNLPTIRWMVENAQMPPPGFELGHEERAQLKQFIEGV